MLLVMNAATITVRRSRENLAADTEDAAVFAGAFGEGSGDCRCSLVSAPEGRGTEIHATSEKLNQKRLKAGLRAYRALVEAGEIPTGERTR